MKKILLCVIIALSTLTSCSNDERETAKVDNSFSHKIIDVKGYDSANNYVESGYDKAVNENSKIVYNEKDKTISLNISSGATIFTITSIVNGVYNATYILPTSIGFGNPITMKVEISFVNGNIIFLTTKTDTTFLAKIEYVLAK